MELLDQSYADPVTGAEGEMAEAAGWFRKESRRVGRSTLFPAAERRRRPHGQSSAGGPDGPLSVVQARQDYVARQGLTVEPPRIAGPSRRLKIALLS
jgi:hypothetical protein